MYVMGEASTERPATADEIARMRAIVREAVVAGAVGFATSKSPTHVGYEGRPVPSRVAELSEIEALAGALGELDRGIVQATAGPGFFVSEFGELVKRIRRPFTWTALLAGMMGPGSHKWMLEMNVELQRQNIPVIPQVSCRPLNFEFQMKEPFIFESMPLFQPISAADLEGKKRIYADPEFRRAFREKTGEGVFATRWERTWISDCAVDHSLEERTVAEVARERNVDPIDLVLDLSLATGLEARFRMAVVNTDEDAVQELLTSPATMLGLSDAGAHASQLCDACFSTDLLSRWVREKGVIRLEEAVRMLTSRPAEVFGIRDRGRLATGMPADVVIFDAATVGAGKLRRVHDMPAGADRLVADASGVDGVIVNGTVIRRQGRDVVDPEGPLPGKVLRSGAASSRI
jgi:N-acyl-D-aspartate/D-glutamate deacylase